MTMTRRVPTPLLFISLLLFAVGARAQDNPALYQATSIVTGTDMRQRPLGFARCLMEVLAKVSGVPRLREEPAVAALAKHAETFVDAFSYVDPQAWRLPHDDQGTYDRSYELTVRFDPTKIDTALTGLGVVAWRGERPLLEPVILVRGREAPPFLLTAETPAGTDMRASIVSLAGEYGVGVRFPTEADLAAWSVSPVGFPAPLGTPDPAALQITGSLAWNVYAGGWIGLWRVRLNGVERDWRIAGVGFDQAFADMIRGGVMLAHGTGTP